MHIDAEEMKELSASVMTVCMKFMNCLPQHRDADMVMINCVKELHEFHTPNIKDTFYMFISYH